MARFVFRVWRLFAHSHVRHQSSLSVADEAARSLKVPAGVAQSKDISQIIINVGGVNGRGRNTLAAVGAVLKIVEV